MELMSIISKLNDTILTDDSTNPSLSDIEGLIQLEQRLRSLRQYLTRQGLTFSVAGDESGVLDVLDTAELYRIAALIFLERACRRKSRRSSEVEHLVEAGLAILQRLKVCAVMWPLFIIACEAETDEQRTIVLATFETSTKFRKAGNIPCVQGLAEAVWKQDDLFTYSGIAAGTVPLLRYGSIISASRQLPNFT